MVESSTMNRCGFVICAAVFAGVLLPGCRKPPPPVQLKLPATAPAGEISYADLAVVLDGALDKRGYIEPIFIERLEGRLLAQLGLLARLGPASAPGLLPDRACKLAYWYNARSAWSIYLAMDMYRAGRKTVQGLSSRRFPLDGREMTLADIDARLYALGGIKAVIAAPSADEHRAKLPRKPFRAEDIQRRIARRFDEYFADRGRFVIDIETQQIRLAPVIWQYRDEILRRYYESYGAPQATLRTALGTMVTGLGRYRLQQAVGYKCLQDTTPAGLTVND